MDALDGGLEEGIVRGAVLLVCVDSLSAEEEDGDLSILRVVVHGAVESEPV
jgi:predicted AAA+ superfamily ATPase